MHHTINHLELFRYYRMDSLAAEGLRRFLAQLLETYIQEGQGVPVIITLSKPEFENLAQAYHDLLIGYKHPRINSLNWRWRTQDRTLTKLKNIFVDWNPVDKNAMSSIYENS